MSIKNMPLGTNELSAEAMFKERSFYRDAVFEIKKHLSPTIDLWYDKTSEKSCPGKMLYGRVDKSGFPVYLAEENLKQLSTLDGETYFALNFVADAFHDFQRWWERKRPPGFNRGSGALARMQPHGAWTSVHRKFYEIYSTNYDIFTSREQFLSTQRDEKIINFEGFLKVFREYANIMLPDRPMTCSGYIVSKWAAPEFSGLMINTIKNPQHGDDFAKFAAWVEDDDYDFYAKSASRFGFVVDVNAPWRLIADVSSPPMADYMAEYGVNSLKEMFEAYYIPAHKYDIDVLRHYMRNMYNSYVVASPNIKVKVPSECQDGKTIWKLTKREVLTVEAFERRYPPRYWIRLYVWLKAKESDKSWSQRKFNAVVRKAQTYEKALNIEAALKYISGECLDYRPELHGLPTLSKLEAETVLVKKKVRPRSTFNF